MNAPENIALFVLGALVLALLIWVIRLHMRVKNLLLGKGAQSLEDTILALKRESAELVAARQNIENFLSQLHARQRKGLSRLETLRFNPFRGNGSGGNQSFVTAIANEEGDGIILSGLYSRERVNVYAKPLKNFESEIQLSDEEQEIVGRIKK